MNYFTTRETHLFPSFRLDAKEQEKLDRFLLLLDRSEVAELFPLKDMNEIKSGGRPHYSYYDLFAVILYGFAFSSGTLRDLEDSCRFDLRYIYLMQENMPSYVVFAEMINTLFFRLGCMSGFCFWVCRECSLRSVLFPMPGSDTGSGNYPSISDSFFS